MFSIFSKKKKDRPVPEWAQFLDKIDYNNFMDLVDEYFQKRNVEFKIEDGLLTAEDKNLGLTDVGLVYIAKYCYNQESEKWGDIINDHFEAIIQTNQFEREFATKISDFDQIESYLGVRIFHISQLEHIGIQNTVFRQIAGDLVEGLVFDFPHASRNVKPMEVRNSGLAPDILFEIGLSNIKSKYKVDISKQTIGDFDLWFIQSENIFGTSFILDKEEFTKRCGSKGALVTIPHRHAMLVYPIETIEMVKALTAMIPITINMFDEGPGSISEKVYWYDGAKFVTLPYEIKEQELGFYPPEDFVTMMNALPGEIK